MKLALSLLALLGIGGGLAGCAEPMPASVLLVSLDTLRADAVAGMPFLDSMARRGVSFPRVYSASNWTLPSHVSLFTSQPYSEHRVPSLAESMPFATAALPERSALLTEVFSGYSYRTFASTEGGYLNPDFGFARGFDEFHLVPAFSHDPATDIDRHVTALTELVARSGSTPIFAFVHTYRAHDYFMNAPRFQGAALPRDAAWLGRGSLLPLLRKSDGSEPPQDFLERLYAGAVGDADRFLERLVRGALAADPRRPWLVVVTSDHGEGFHPDPNLRGHGSALVEEQLRVPWIAWTEGEQPSPLPQAPAALASGLDVAPSILDWAGLPIPETFRGRGDLLRAADAPERDALEVAFVDFGMSDSPRPQLAMVARERALLRVQRAGVPSVADCLRLASERPGIANWQRAADGCDALDSAARNRLRAWMEAEAKTPRATGKAPSEALLEELRALGYL